MIHKTHIGISWVGLVSVLHFCKYQNMSTRDYVLVCSQCCDESGSESDEGDLEDGKIEAVIGEYI